MAAAVAAVKQSIKKQSVKAEFLVVVKFLVAIKRLAVISSGVE